MSFVTRKCRKALKGIEPIYIHATKCWAVRKIDEQLLELEKEGDCKNRVGESWTKWRETPRVICDKKVPESAERCIYIHEMRYGMLGREKERRTSSKGDRHDNASMDPMN